MQSFVLYYIIICVINVCRSLSTLHSNKKSCRLCFCHLNSLFLLHLFKLLLNLAFIVRFKEALFSSSDLYLLLLNRKLLFGAVFGYNSSTDSWIINTLLQFLAAGLQVGAFSVHFFELIDDCGFLVKNACWVLAFLINILLQSIFLISGFFLSKQKERKFLLSWIGKGILFLIDLFFLIL